MSDEYQRRREIIEPYIFAAMDLEKKAREAARVEEERLAAIERKKRSSFWYRLLHGCKADPDPAEAPKTPGQLSAEAKLRSASRYEVTKVNKIEADHMKSEAERQVKRWKRRKG